MTPSSDGGDTRLYVETIASESTARIVIQGEADVADADDLRTALDSIDLDGAKTVQLHVADLTFVDVAALRELTSFACHMKRAGRTVATHGARPELHRMALILGVHDELGLPDQAR